jgi:serine/threonine protein kinase
MKVTLTVIEGPHQGSSFDFIEHDAFLVGRSPETQFRLPLRDRTLSRVHFLIEVNPPLCRLMDMASTNGVRGNGKKVLKADLNDGDRIQAGNTIIAFAVKDDEMTEIQGAHLSLATRAPTETETKDWSGVPIFPGYTIDRTIGEGGMGIVYLGRREIDSQAVALKVIKPVVATQDAILGRFLQEASILRRLEHPNIVRFLDIGYASSRLYFAMEYVEGTNVTEALKARGPFSIPSAIGLTCQVLNALSYAHGLGFVHRDIKPANLLITRKEGKNQAKLADFGLAKIYQESSLSGMSVTGQMGGTLAFMPPEQITHFRDAKPTADIYALGATLYNLLTDKTTFDFKGRAEQQVARILFDAPTPIQTYRPEIPGALAEIIHRSLAKAPADRFPDAQSMKEALSPFAKSR